MPPLYDWTCSKCKAQVSVLRSFDDYNQPPSKDESPTQPAKEDEKDIKPSTKKRCKHKWERKIGGNQSVVKGPGWGLGKGYYNNSGW